MLPSPGMLSTVSSPPMPRQIAADRQAEPDAVLPPGELGVDLDERVEDASEIFFSFSPESACYEIVVGLLQSGS